MQTQPVIFYLASESEFSYLIVTAPGYLRDSISVVGIGHQQLKVTLIEVNEIGAAKIKGDPKNAHIGRKPAKTEIITHSELKKAACCDLAVVLRPKEQ